jgi:hypothetical protein
VPILIGGRGIRRRRRQGSPPKWPTTSSTGYTRRRALSGQARQPADDEEGRARAVPLGRWVEVPAFNHEPFADHWLEKALA